MELSWVAVNEKQIEVDGEKKWVSDAIGTESQLLLEIDVFSCHWTNPAMAFLYRLTENHELDETEFLVDVGGYLPALVRRELSSQRNDTDRTYVETRFQTVSPQIDRFRSCRESSQRSPLAATVQTPFQPRSTESSARWPNTSRGGPQLNSAVHSVLKRGLIECSFTILADNYCLGLLS